MTLKEWGLAVLLLVFAAILVAIGWAEHDADLMAVGTAIIVAIGGGAWAYYRIMRD